MHFPNPKSKSPSKYTKELQDNQRNTLPFNDKRDYDEVIKGFIAAPETRQIFAEDGHVVWDIGSYIAVRLRGKKKVQNLQEVW